MKSYQKVLVLDTVFLASLFLGVTGDSVLLIVTTALTWLAFLSCSLYVLMHHHPVMFKVRVEQIHMHADDPHWWPVYDVLTDVLWLALLAYGGLWLTLGAAAIATAVKFWNKRVREGMIHQLEA